MSVTEAKNYCTESPFVGSYNNDLLKMSDALSRSGLVEHVYASRFRSGRVSARRPREPALWHSLVARPPIYKQGSPAHRVRALNK